MNRHGLQVLTCLLYGILALGVSAPLLAQTNAKTPLEQLLNADGALNLNRGFRGSLDPKGWQMRAGPNGEPHFVSAGATAVNPAPQFMAVPDDANWDDRFFLNGTEKPVSAVAVDGNGNVYVGGEFVTAGNAVVNHIAKWDGSNWSALDGGMSTGFFDAVLALAVDGNGNVYAGGKFTSAGGVSANNIAKWDGSSWSALGSGTNDQVNALAADGSGNLYAGSVYFSMAGGVSVNRVAKWNGSSWSALGSGINNPVYSMAVDSQDNLYVGGYYTSAGGVSANGIAKWNGSSWSALGSGITSAFGSGFVYSLTVDDNDNVFAGGYFTTAGGFSASNIAKWNGSTWSALGSGTNATVTALAADASGNLYAGGNFGSAGGMSAAAIAKWNGSSWSAMGSGVNLFVYALATDANENLFVGGWFSNAGGVNANNVAEWNGSSWSKLGLDGQGLAGPSINALALDGNGNVYAGGDLSTAGNLSTNYVAKWDGNSWSALGGTLNDRIYDLAVDGSGNLYAAGTFNTIGGVSAIAIAKWNGSSWSALSTGMNWTVYALVVDGSGNLYAGGGFSTAGGVTVNYVAKWDGSNWSALGGGLNGFVYALTLDGSGNLYAGGRFTMAGGASATNIAKWNGSAWSALGSGLIGGEDNDGIWAVAVDGNGNVYAGGDITNAGGVSTTGIAKWDGSNWSALGSGLNAMVRELVVDDNDNVYAGGFFTAAGAVNVNRIAKWDGGSWSALGSGMNGNVYALMLEGNGNLDAGGNFAIAGDKVSLRFGRYQLPATVKPFVFLANKVTLKQTKQATPAGNIHSNGALTIEKGTPSKYLSNLTAVGKITINKQNTINGDVTSQTAISNSGTINGTPSVEPVDNEPLPSLSYSAGGLNKTVPSNGSLTLAPGSYGIVTLNSGGTLKLASGEYFMTELRALSSATVIEIDLTSGDEVVINVVSNLQLGKEAAIQLLPNGEGDSEKATFNTLQSSAVSFGKEAYLLGSFNAPNAKVTLVKNTQLRGSICANEILVERDCLFLHHDATGTLPGPGNLPKTSFDSDEEEVSSDQLSVISDYALAQNYPNPFNPSTVISFQLPVNSDVTLAIYNTNGQLVKKLVAGEMNAGQHSFTWDATNERGVRVASGVYVYRLQAGEFVAKRKLVLMK